MKKRIHRSRTCAALIPLLLAAGCLAARGQAYRVRPLTPNPNPQLIVGNGTLTVSATPTLVNFSLVPKSTATGSSGVTITTDWNVVGYDPVLTLYGYFTSATQALSDGATPPYYIPSSAVLGQMTTGLPTAYTAFTQTTPYGGAGAGLELLDTTETGFGNISGKRTDVLNLEIDLSGVPDLPAGTYTGTLTLQASIN